MSIHRVGIEAFLAHDNSIPIFDVRSPGEYSHAHIPGAHSLPLFTDDERRIIGTQYKHEGRKPAIKTGLQYFGPSMLQMVETVERITGVPNVRIPVRVHCWRGGMRSAAVAWLLDLYGYEVYTLENGYKAYRNWVLKQFDKPYPLKVLGGYTGSGKTGVLKALETVGYKVIDLEAIAGHKGSAFGKVEGIAQPGQEMFENLLAEQLYLRTQDEGDIWIEDESQRIGQVNIPGIFWTAMRDAPLYFLDIPFEERLGNIVKEYGSISQEQLINAIIRIKKRLGGLETKTAINALLENDTRTAFAVLLKYYDKHYGKALNSREDSAKMNMIPCDEVDVAGNMNKLTEHKH
jgi:tRNA 2-selenouridine synthase